MSFASTLKQLYKKLEKDRLLEEERKSKAQKAKEKLEEMNRVFNEKNDQKVN